MTVVLDITCERTCVPSEWASGRAMPRLAGRRKSPARFKSSRMVITESIRATFLEPASGDRVLVIADVENAGDLDICAAAIDERPILLLSENGGMPATCFAANAYPHSIAALPIEAGAEVALVLAIKDTAMFRVRPPNGCTTNDIVELTIESRIVITGLRVD